MIDLARSYAIAKLAPHMDMGNLRLDAPQVVQEAEIAVFDARIAARVAEFEALPEQAVAVRREGDAMCFQVDGCTSCLSVDAVELARFSVAELIASGFARAGVRVDPEQVQSAIEAVSA